GTIQNSQCTVNAGSTTVSPSGNTLTLNLPVTFAAGYAGAKTTYRWAGDAGGSNSGWQPRGAWTVLAGSGTPSTVSVSPSSGTGNTQTFALQYSDTAGATTLSSVYVWFVATGTQVNSCVVQYARAANTLYLMNDAANGWSSATPGVAGTIQNSQCTINAGSTTVSPSGNSMTLNLPVTFAAGYAGSSLTLYMWAGDAGGSNSGWQPRGAWTVPAGSRTPSTVSVSPSSGTGNTQTFALQYSDTAGATSLSSVYGWFVATGTQVSSCVVQYARASNTLYLLNDAANGWSSATPGVAGTIQNSQCTIN